MHRKFRKTSMNTIYFIYFTDILIIKVQNVVILFAFSRTVLLQFELKRRSTEQLDKYVISVSCISFNMHGALKYSLLYTVNSIQILYSKMLVYNGSTWFMFEVLTYELRKIKPETRIVFNQWAFQVLKNHIFYFLHFSF